MSKEETLAIPADVREQVYQRDKGRCRVCGELLKVPGIHHIIYGGDRRGTGGRRVHNPDEMVTIGWTFPDKNCHLIVHSSKRLWQPLLLEVVSKPGITALQLLRWKRNEERRAQ